MQKIIDQLYGIDLEEFNNKNAKIAQQVEEHIELLEEIKEKIIKSIKKKNGVFQPEFRCQNPDAWSNPKISSM